LENKRVAISWVVDENDELKLGEVRGIWSGAIYCLTFQYKSVALRASSGRFAYRAFCLTCVLFLGVLFLDVALTGSLRDSLDCRQP
jgi:hypothetical protein